MIHILVSPIRAVLPDIPGSTAYYILCSSAPLNLGPYPHVRTFHFLDTTEETNPRRFKPVHAELILEFFRSLPDGADLFVCCDAGESRSAAIAAALKRLQGEDESEFWSSGDYAPNRLVYDICCRNRKQIQKSKSIGNAKMPMLLKHKKRDDYLFRIRPVLTAQVMFRLIFSDPKRVMNLNARKNGLVTHTA